MTCRCGHAQARHLFQHGQCLHTVKQEGDTLKHCRCTVFEAAGVVPVRCNEVTGGRRKPVLLDFDLGTTGGDGV